MVGPTEFLLWSLAVGPSCVGLAQCAIGAGLAWCERWGRPVVSPHPAGGVSILKPLHGAEPLLDEALESFCAQNYAGFQIIFGVQDAADPALASVQRVLARHPHVDARIVVDPTLHGRNRKIGNILNMLPYARHDALLISDSDIHVAPDYLATVMATLALPDTGLVTTLYSGRPAFAGAIGQLGAGQINHAFLPGVLMARRLGRQACLGATMALRRQTLDAIGGLSSLVDTLADDAELGLRVNQLGLQVRLAPTVPATTVPETELGPLLQHELRWARTTRALAPLQYGLSVLQYPLFWAGLTVALSGLLSEALPQVMFGASKGMLSGGTTSAIILFLIVWGMRWGAGRMVDLALGIAAPREPIWMLPLRDLLSVFVILASFGGDNVKWRGHTLSAARTRLVAGKG